MNTMHTTLVTAPWRDVSLTARRRAAALLAELTLEEKVGQLGSIWQTESGGDFAPTAGDDAAELAADTDFRSGLGQITRAYGTRPVTPAEGAHALRTLQEEVMTANRLGIPALVHEECLTGFAALGATAYPTPLAWAASFDEDLIRRMAAAIGADMRALGIHQGLSPVLDVVKDYRWGRVEETLGEDPYTVGILGSAYVAGLESAGIIATLKHFAGYAGSRGARNHAPVDAGPREFADTVLPPFLTALRLGGARSVMNSYTDIDGVPAAANPELFTGILRDEWGFEGTVVSDYWAIPFLASMHRVAEDNARAGVLAITAGIDVELPETVSFGRDLVEAVRSGAVPGSVLDDAVLRHLTHKIESGLLDDGPVVPEDAGDRDLDSPGNREIARALAAESVILLENRDGILPLDRPKRIAVIGPTATDARNLLGCYAFPNHVLGSYPEFGLGLASSSLAEAVVSEFADARVEVQAGCDISGQDRSGIEAAVEAARGADVAVVAVGDLAGLFGRGTSGEGCDALDLRLPGIQQDLVDAVLATGTPVVLVVLSGRPYALGRYSGRTAALVQSFFPGIEGSAAIASVLSGRVSPSGRLPVQIPRDERVFSTYLQPLLGRAASGITVSDPTPLFAFGHGLSYGTVSYESISAPETSVPVDGTVRVRAVIANRGEDDLVEVVQLYASDHVAEVVRPVIQLVGFARITVRAGSTVAVAFDVPTDILSFTGRDGRRIVEPGLTTFFVGPSAADLPLSAEVEIVGERRPVGADRALRSLVTTEIIE